MVLCTHEDHNNFSGQLEKEMLFFVAFVCRHLSCAFVQMRKEDFVILQDTLTLVHWQDSYAIKCTAITFEIKERFPYKAMIMQKSEKFCNLLTSHFLRLPWVL